MLGQLGYRPIALMAARATLALKAGVWFRRGRLLMFSPARGDYRRLQAETPLSDLFKFAEPALLFFLRKVSKTPSGQSRRPHILA